MPHGMKPHEIRKMANEILSDKPSMVSGGASTIESDQPEIDEASAHENGTDVEHMHIRPFSNGWAVSTHHREGKGNASPKEFFFGDHEKVAAHVRKTLGAHLHGYESSDEPDLKETKV
jgi:hypothetical protein